MKTLLARISAAFLLAAALASGASAAEPHGKVTIAWHVTISPAWFDPSSAPPQITPFGMMYAIHDALVRPYPGQKMGPSLAQSWEESEDGLTYTFKLRPNLTFHNGDPLTTDDVKFSWDRYNGAGATTLKAHVKDVEIVDPLTIRFHLNAPWPDFMTFYGTTATAAGIVMPKKYFLSVGEDGFKNHPIGAGPYKFVSQKPGIEVVLEAFPQYWRRVPNVKTIVMRSVPDATTRALMVRTGEADIAYALDGVDAEGLKADPNIRIVATKHASIFWVEMSEQWDPKSPWHDPRVRLAVNYALDREGINQAACLGFCPPAGVIVPRVMEYALQVKPIPYDPEKAKALLAEAGFPNGINAGEFAAIPGFPTVGEAVMNDLNAVGIHVTLKQMERAAFYSAWQQHQLHGIYMVASGNSGNAASRIESFIQSKGAYANGGYPDIDEMFKQQATERDSKKRAEILDKIQQLTIDRVMFAPVMDLRALNGVGPRVTKDTITDVWMSPFPSYEDMEIKD
ncbi:MAG TPA: ABC transporter substrate-binding protein [Stellaceae bacterium]|jgi:peptide/nickel transport system substrate-binding protein|nr:ABC transporter substrate-binding protein [Stellaceae bacterium]